MRTPSHLNAAAAAAVIVSSLLCGCASTKPLEPRTLPYHVAIIPMENPTIGEVSPDELPGKPTDLSLNLTCHEITEAVSRALEEYCFSRVTVLEHEDLDANTDAFERQRLILERARAAGADLIIELGLRYDSEVYREKSSTFWLNYPLFLLLGPSNWFLGDNGYYADVELTTSVYDLNVIEAGAFSIGDAAARVVGVSSRYSGTELDFFDRSDGVEDYALGILIPSGFLARESDSTAQEVQATIIEQLRAQVVQGIQSRRGELVLGEWIAPVYVDPDDVRILREGDELVVTGSVRVRRGGLVERVRALHLNAGAEGVTVQPTASPTDGGDGYDVQSFEVRVPAAAKASELRMEVEAGSRDGFVRSYTFRVPEKAQHAQETP